MTGGCAGRESAHTLFHDNNMEKNMIKNMVNDRDCTAVDSSIRLQDLKQWKISDKEPMPYYLHAGDSGGVVFNGKPEIVRQLLKIYNTQKLFFQIKLVSFLNSEGIAARRVSAPVGDVLGYSVDPSNN